MNEYVCEVMQPEPVVVDVHERVTRCKDCRFFWPGVANVAVDWCSLGDGHDATPMDFCSQAKPMEDGGRDGE